jgi:putative transposase
MMREAKHDVLAFRVFPKSHWQKIWSNNPIERLNKETKRAPTSWRSPQSWGVPALATAVVIEAHDEWPVTRRSELPVVIAAKQHAASQNSTPESLTLELENA